MKGSNHISSLIRKEDQLNFQKLQPRSNTKLMSMPDQRSSPFRYSRKKKESFESDSEVQSFLHSSNNIERVIISESKKLKRVTNQLQITKCKIEQLEFKYSTNDSKETVDIIKSMQQQYSNEISSLKASIQQRRIDQHSSNMKQKQKTTALFLQVVRLGDAFEKIENNVLGMTGIQGRLQYLQGKTVHNNKNIKNLAHRTNNDTDILSEFAQKIINRVESVQTTLLNLGKQHHKHKQQVSRINSLVSRITQDLGSLLNNMQADIQNQIQSKVGEFVYKALYQREEKAKISEEIRKNIDFKERLMFQKQRSQKQYFQAKYLSMDTNVRNQFMRKDQSIKALQQSLQLQYKSIQKQIQQSNRIKQQSDTSFKVQLKRIQQGFRKQYDVYKQQQLDIMNGMQDIIKVEVGSRLNSDIDLKNLTSTIATYLAGDLNDFKDSFNKHIKQINVFVKQIQSNSTARDAQISKFVDDQFLQSKQKYNKLKGVFTKFTQQFRTHLVTNQTNRKSIDQRFNETEKDFNKLRAEINNIVDDFHSSLEIKIREDKEYEKDRKQQRDIYSKIIKLQEYMNYSFDAMKQTIESTKRIISSRIDDIKAPRLDVKQLSDKFGNIKLLIEQLRIESQQNNNSLKHIIQINQQRIQDQIQNIKLRIDDDSSNYQYDKNINSNSSSIKNALDRLQNQVELNKATANQNFKKIHQDVRIAQSNINQLQTILKSGLSNMQQEVLKTNNQFTILQSQVKSSQQSVRQDIQKLVQLVEENDNNQFS